LASRFFSRLIIIILFKSRYFDCGELDFQSSFLQCLAGREKNYILIVVHGRKSIMNRFFARGWKNNYLRWVRCYYLLLYFFSVQYQYFLNPLTNCILYRDRPTVGSYYINIYTYAVYAIEILRWVFRSLRPRGRVERIENGIRIATRFAVNVNRNRDVFCVKILYCLPRCNI